jgi:uncharacterized protein (TIGR00730 family)
VTSRLAAARNDEGVSLQRVCVFCGASPGGRPAYLEAATALGRELARRGIGLVYGAGGRGVMGALADGALAAGGHVTGVIPRALVDRELGRHDLGDLRVVGSMHERKALMHELSDGFVTLPGGLGTFEELFEIVTWGQLGLHAKPVVLLDVESYFSPLLAMLDHAVAEGFVRPSDRDPVRRAGSVMEALALLEHPPNAGRPRLVELDET